jgi:NAD(P)-dependent dehydrogenase (short-subunit alcohol dehydrogenase family)
VSEIGRFDQRMEEEFGVAQDRPVKPNLKTLDIDLTGVLYTTRIALWYFYNDKRENPGLRSIAFTGSMSSFYGATMGVMYGASKA